MNLKDSTKSLDYDRFDYTLNTTSCSDETTCPNSNNQTCCTKNQGINETDYRSDGALPVVAGCLSSYYAAAGYSATILPTATLAPSVCASNPQKSGDGGNSSGSRNSGDKGNLS